MWDAGPTNDDYDPPQKASRVPSCKGHCKNQGFCQLDLDVVG